MYTTLISALIISNGITAASDEQLETSNEIHEFPYISCPLIFQYVKDWDFGGWFGLISLPKPSPADDDIKLELNMSYNGPISADDNLKLMLISTKDELEGAEFLKWAAIFPFQNNYPKVTSMRLNEVQMCTNYPDAAPPGVQQTNLWAISRIRNELKGKTKRKETRQNVFNNGSKYVPHTRTLPGIPVIFDQAKLGRRKKEFQDYEE